MLLREEIAKLARTVAKLDYSDGRDRIDDHFLKSHALPEPGMYPALASKIGLLDSSLVLSLTEFFRKFQEVRSALPLLSNDLDRGYRFSSLILLEPAAGAVQNVVPGLRAIEKLCVVNVPIGAPDLGMAEDIIEMEHRSFHGQK